MKFRQWTAIAVLLALSAVPAAFAQDPSTTPDTDKPDATQAPAPSQPQISAPVAQPDDSKVKHDGSKNDVDAIGNRKVGGRGMGNWYSLEGEIRMGKEYATQIEASLKQVAASPSDWDTVIANVEWLGYRFEEESDRARRDESAERDRQLRR